MALIIIPTVEGDSFISVLDADTVISKNSVHSAEWLTLTDTQKEVYLRIATSRILRVVSTDIKNENGYLDISTYDAAKSCLPKATAMMAVHDLAYGLSSEVNPNTGLVSKEKVGDLEVTYFHGNPLSQINSRKTTPYPNEVIPCLESYGALITTSSVRRAKLIRS